MYEWSYNEKTNSHTLKGQMFRVLVRRNHTLTLYGTRGKKTGEVRTSEDRHKKIQRRGVSDYAGFTWMSRVDFNCHSKTFYGQSQDSVKRKALAYVRLSLKTEIDELLATP